MGIPLRFHEKSTQSVLRVISCQLMACPAEFTSRLTQQKPVAERPAGDFPNCLTVQSYFLLYTTKTRGISTER